MRTIIFILFLILGPYALADNDLTKNTSLWNINRIDTFANSSSPDGLFKVIKASYKDTTFSRVGIVQERTKSIYYVIDVSPDPKCTSFLWSPDSNYLAIHDSSKAHSKLRLFSVKGNIGELKLPDLTSYSIARLSLSRNEISSSGQLPVQWLSDNVVQVQMRLKLKSGISKTILTSLTIQTKDHVKISREEQ